MTVPAQSVVVARRPDGELRPLLEPPDPYRQATSAAVHLAVVLAGFDLAVAFGVSLVLPLVVLALPLWAKAVARYALAPAILVLAVAAAASGLVLSSLAAYDHEINQGSRVQMVGLLLSGMAAFVAVLWARQTMPLARVVALYGLGGVAGAVLDGRLTWKFGVAIPATFLILGLLERRGPRGKPIVGILVLGLVGVVDDYRSYFAFCVLAAALALWQIRPLDDGRSPSRWWPALLLGAMGAAVYLLTSTLLTAGYLGEGVQQRSQEQIERSGSLLAGGRPEWAATLELAALRPIGYGVGVIPNLEDVHVAKEGLDSINIGLNPERDRYMFGSEFRLHSIIADLWVRFGLVGFALALTMVFAVVRGLSFSLAQRTATPAVLLAALLALWSFVFEPSTTYWVRVCVAMGFVLVVRRARPVEPAPARR